MIIRELYHFCLRREGCQCGGKSVSVHGKHSCHSQPKICSEEVNVMYNCCTLSCISRKLYLFVRIFTVVDVVNISCIWVIDPLRIGSAYDPCHMYSIS